MLRGPSGRARKPSPPPGFDPGPSSAERVAIVIQYKLHLNRQLIGILRHTSLVIISTNRRQILLNFSLKILVLVYAKSKNGTSVSVTSIARRK